MGIEEILAESRRLMVDLSFGPTGVNTKYKSDGPKKEYLQPSRSYIYREFLVPVGFELDPWQQIKHIWTSHYNDYPIYLKYEEWYEYVVHSHPPTSGCSANTFCHLHQYRPTGSEHPIFIRNFYMKWPNLNENQSPSTNGNSAPVGSSESGEGNDGSKETSVPRLPRLSFGA